MQATIDYILGNHTIEVFQEIQQKFEASQPGDADRWAKVRATASKFFLEKFNNNVLSICFISFHLIFFDFDF